MKKLQQYLLTRYPLIWNTRIFILLPAILLLHVLYFFAGYLRHFDAALISRYDIEPGGSAVMFAVLLGALLLISWLLFYFRNNPLKSLYPVARGKLFAEYACIALVTCGAVSFTESYRAGSYLAFNKQFRDVDVVKEANTVNLAHYFIAFDFAPFHYTNSCDSIQRNSGTSVYTATPSDNVLPDSLAADFSYLNYCRCPVSLTWPSKGLLTARELHTIAARWLKEGKKDSVRFAIGQYLALCKTYGAAVNFNTGKWVDELFRDPRFPVSRIVETSYYSGRRSEYIETYTVDNSLESIDRYRYIAVLRGDALAFLFAGLACSILIFSFRVTRTRTWFIALVGACVWGIFFGLLGAAYSSGELPLMLLLMALNLVFLAFSLAHIHRGRHKQSAGVALIWFQWSLPLMLPFLATVLQRVLRVSVYVNGYYEQATKQPWLVTWIGDNFDTIMYLDLVLTLTVLALVVMPAARRWQAMPEE